MIDFEPKYITFDCYGTLTKFHMSDMSREFFAGQLEGADMDRFIAFFAGYRRDEVLGAWKPYRDVIANAYERACKRMNVKFVESDAEKIYEAVPTWGPHPDVPEGLARLAKKYKLVILSNASNSQIQSNVDKLGAPFHAVFTAEQTGAYKPRMQGFEYMFDKLGCKPEDVLHVSSSPRYDLFTAHDMGVKHKAMVLREHEQPTPGHDYHLVKDIPHLAAELGL
ncbi:haloacid dehalogenase type II [Robbsia sp. Bb-Pol-6]|uniref:Haloacid dehalogenase type II n=1 Tax=Robbsia betulipollinis TaxID=2981849 RepID=A0ABT3ZS56_9BURK|nr:haloacid dehalogenase type II [Robbsia betulipollinis]MCY0389257.1 haloacid dehalogenase type II [Robbsia betulipollinis]